MSKDITEVETETLIESFIAITQSTDELNKKLLEKFPAQHALALAASMQEDVDSGAKHLTYDSTIVRNIVGLISFYISLGVIGTMHEELMRRGIDMRKQDNEPKK